MKVRLQDNELLNTTIIKPVVFFSNNLEKTVMEIRLVP